MGSFTLRIAATVAVVAAGLVHCVPDPASLNSDVTILIDSDLEGANSPSASTAVLLLDGPRTSADAAIGCEALGERQWSPDGVNMTVFQRNLDYLALRTNLSSDARFWISDARTITVKGEVGPAPDPAASLPVLCTQTAPFSNETFQDVSDRWQISVTANGETLIGYRDRLSFRFLGVRYASQPKRFTHSELYKGTGQSLPATQFGSQCAQGTNTGTEDCLFLNIFTPYLPSSPDANKAKLRPVMFWIHGGAFTGGTANDATMDGGGLTSRGDVVLVNINYRLSTLGFLALDDGVTKGNYGLGDQIVALDWVRQNIARFGGDPDRITIFGQSAGAGSVRALMASPKAKGKFQRAILLSNLGGLAYGTTYSRYYTIAEEMSVAGQAILNATGCASSPIAQQADCLRAVPAFNLTSMPTVARFLVVDGDILTTQQLQVLGPPLGIDVMLGIMADDGAPFAMFPTTTDAATYLPTQGFPTVPEPAFFPIPPASNFAGNETLALYNMTSRLATDGIFRCVDQATVAAGLAGPSEPSLGRRVFYYEFDRSYQTTGWPKTDVCEAPRTADRPNGDPSLPHFRCHSGELYYVFGTLARQRLPERDGNDYPFMRFVLDAFASFARTGDPNPEVSFLTAKGFDETLREITRDGGRWLPSLAAAEGGTPDSLTMRILQWPEPYQSSFRELPQCASLGIGLDYYMPSAMSGWRRLQ